MFRDALDGVHGLGPDTMPTLKGRFPEVRAGIAARRAEGEYGFLALGDQPGVVRQVAEWAARQQGRWHHVLVLGIGGSALGTRALVTALRPAAWNEWDAGRREGFPTITILENVDPVTVMAALDRLDPRHTLVNVISKSGGTAETLAQYLLVRQWLELAVGPDQACDHMVITTDPAVGPLRAIAERDGIRAFEVPPAVGGRFSVLTPVGLVPAALVGIDIAELVAGAANAVRQAEAEALEANPAALWAALQWQAQHARAANIHVLMPYSDRLRDLGEWFRQLWAESLGKRVDREGREVFRGPTPVTALGATDQHSQVQLFAEGPFDKTITFVRVRETIGMLAIPAGQGIATPPAAARHARGDGRQATGDPPEASFAYLMGQTLGALLDAEFVATREALRQAGRMSCTIELEAVTPRSLGELLMFFQCATGFAGAWYDVNPFDQPGVELGKKLTVRQMTDD
jgi:glucose-6-phosphate isomerase